MDALRVLVRRWYIIVAGCLLMAVAALGAIRWVPTTYQSSGQVLLLLPPEATGTRTPTNPYLNLQDGLIMTAAVVAGTLTTRDTERDMRRDGYTSEYAIALNPGGGPLLVITAKDTNGQEAMETRDELIHRVSVELERMQVEVNVPIRQWIRPTQNAVGEHPEPLPGNKIRALAAIAGVGVTSTLAAAFLVERFRPRRLAGRKHPKPSRRARPTSAPSAVQRPEAGHAPTTPMPVEPAAHALRPASQQPKPSARPPSPAPSPNRWSPTRDRGSHVKRDGVSGGSRR